MGLYYLFLLRSCASSGYKKASAAMSHSMRFKIIPYNNEVRFPFSAMDYCHQGHGFFRVGPWQYSNSWTLLFILAVLQFIIDQRTQFFDDVTTFGFFAGEGSSLLKSQAVYGIITDIYNTSNHASGGYEFTPLRFGSDASTDCFWHSSFQCGAAVGGSLHFPTELPGASLVGAFWVSARPLCFTSVRASSSSWLSLYLAGLWFLGACDACFTVRASKGVHSRSTPSSP